MADEAPRPSAARRPAGRGELKQERAVQTRAQILRAAAEAFAAKGFPAVTILDIAELTGMTKGAVYFHFANKEALAAAVADEFYHRLRGLADAVTAEELPPLPRVTTYLTRTATAFRDDVVIQAGARLQLERSLIDSALPQPYRDYTALLARWLDEAARAGELTAATPEAFARVLVASLFGAQHISWVLTDRADIADRIQEIIQVTLPG
ncbi:MULTISPECIES: ScbR family autoregulator-binding transcription factor [Kitasatospora]|uniref:AcrR family transcriptional regulator n=2 Tax=Kitasatospora TaxID=2063 RepID=A0ABT1J5V3_9ACTN|nr:ScbR family autoregulator-binding transcription factor [Kitasatospora paracochleata]MCP2312810.1 AcrR family transcriptional regulator [Kitasatospora paracochleata]